MKRFYDATNLNNEGGFTPAPEGEYNLSIVDIHDTKEGVQRKTKNGDDYVSVECEIDDPGNWLGKKVFYGVTIMEPNPDGTSRKGAGMAIHFLKSIGEPWEGKIEINTDNWVGKRFRAKLKVTKDNQGKARNEVAYIIDEMAAPADDVPF